MLSNVKRLCRPVGTADRTVELQVWDTAGQERFRSMAPIYYRNAVAAIIVYDVTVMETLRSAQRWAEGRMIICVDQTIHRIAELRLHLPVDMVICVVGNKIDLSYRCVLREQGQQYADSIHALYSETSALTGEGWATQVPAPAPVAGVSHTFEQLAHAIIAKQDKHDAEFVASFSLPPTSNETKVKKNKCCG
jgi:small GTP-binding protein